MKETHSSLNLYFFIFFKATETLVTRCTVNFRCPTCARNCSPESGIVLLKCSHRFCDSCLQDAVRNSEFFTVQCPNDCITACGGILTQDELRALMTPLELEQHMLKRTAEYDCKKCLRRYDTPLVTIKACGHEICLECIVPMILSSEASVVSCWRDNCDSLMKDEEIRSLLTTEQNHLYDETLVNMFYHYYFTLKTIFRSYSKKRWIECRPFPMRNHLIVLFV